MCFYVGILLLHNTSAQHTHLSQGPEAVVFRAVSSVLDFGDHIRAVRADLQPG